MTPHFGIVGLDIGVTGMFLRAGVVLAVAVAAFISATAYCESRDGRQIPLWAGILAVAATALVYVSAMPIVLLPLLLLTISVLDALGVAPTWLDTYLAEGLVLVADVWIVNLFMQFAGNGVRWVMGRPSRPVVLFDWGIIGRQLRRKQVNSGQPPAD